MSKQKKTARQPAGARSRTPAGTPRSSVWFHEVSAPDLVEYATNVCDVAILPLGAIEQHGPHTPCAVDAFNATPSPELAALAELRLSEFRKAHYAQYGEEAPANIIITVN